MYNLRRTDKIHNFISQNPPRELPFPKIDSFVRNCLMMFSFNWLLFIYHVIDSKHILLLQNSPVLLFLICFNNEPGLIGCADGSDSPASRH